MRENGKKALWKSSGFWAAQKYVSNQFFHDFCVVLEVIFELQGDPKWGNSFSVIFWCLESLLGPFWDHFWHHFGRVSGSFLRGFWWFFGDVSESCFEVGFQW